MRKSPLSRPRALQILELKCKCILERDDRRKSCLMGCTYWCKIMSRAAFDLTCMFCNMLQGKQAPNMQSMKQDYEHAHEDVPPRFSLMPWPTTAMSHMPPVCHWSSQAWTGANTPKAVQKQWSGSADTPREQEQEHWMLRMVTILLDSIVDIKQHKAETS